MKFKLILTAALLLLAGCASEPPRKVYASTLVYPDTSTETIIVDYPPPNSTSIWIEYRVWEGGYWRRYSVRGYRDNFGRIYRHR